MLDLSGRKKQTGSGILEILIAVLVVTIGVLGFLQLLQVSLKNTDSTTYRNRAAILVADMFDHLRTDTEDALGGDYNVSFGSGAGGGPTNLQEWLASVSETLPSGSGAVSCVQAEQKCTVSVRWDDERGTGGDDAQVFSIGSLLPRTP